jgi:hypothetical protein
MMDVSATMCFLLIVSWSITAFVIGYLLGRIDKEQNKS